MWPVPWHRGTQGAWVGGISLVLEHTCVGSLHRRGDTKQQHASRRVTYITVAILHKDGARHAVDIKEDLSLPILVELACGEIADKEPLSGLNVHCNLLSWLEWGNKVMRVQLRHVSILGAERFKLSKLLKPNIKTKLETKR